MALAIQTFLPIGSTDGIVACNPLRIFNNEAFEKNESFSVHISAERNVRIDDAYRSVVIIDNDGKMKIRF